MRAEVTAARRRRLSEEEADRAVLQPPPSTNVRAMEVVYRYRLDDAERAAALRAGVAVPLRVQGDSVGTLTAFTRSASHRSRRRA